VKPSTAATTTAAGVKKKTDSTSSVVKGHNLSAALHDARSSATLHAFATGDAGMPIRMAIRAGGRV
jgi:hypothetical protein